MKICVLGAYQPIKFINYNLKSTDVSISAHLLCNSYFFLNNFVKYCSTGIRSNPVPSPIIVPAGTLSNIMPIPIPRNNPPAMTKTTAPFSLVCLDNLLSLEHKFANLAQDIDKQNGLHLSFVLLNA